MDAPGAQEDRWLFPCPSPLTGFWTSGEGGQGEGDSQTSHSLFSPGKRGSADPIALLRPSALPSYSSRLPPPTFISLPSSCLRGRRAFGASVGDSIRPVRMWRVDCFAVHQEKKGHRPPRIEKAEPRKTCTVLRCLVCLFTFRGIRTARRETSDRGALDHANPLQGERVLANGPICGAYGLMNCTRGVPEWARAEENEEEEEEREKGGCMGEGEGDGGGGSGRRRRATVQRENKEPTTQAGRA